MNDQEYLTESAKTLSNSFHTDLVTTKEMEMMFGAAQVAGDWADNIKKALFYGRDYIPKTSPHAAASLRMPTNPNLLHAILGLFTESAELMQHYKEVLEGKIPLDEVNIIEEVGDLLWYMAIIWRDTRIGPALTREINIQKLAKRFPDKFDETRAKQRDLLAERDVLERGVEQVCPTQSTLSLDEREE